MTGWRLTSSIPAMMRSLSSCFDVTRMWRRIERANLEKKPSMRLSQEPCLGVKGELEAVRRLSGEPSLGFSGDVGRMVVEVSSGSSAIGARRFQAITPIIQAADKLRQRSLCWSKRCVTGVHVANDGCWRKADILSDD